MFLFQALQEEIAKRRANLDKMEVLGRELISATGENPFVVAEVQSKLTRVRAQLDRLDARMEQRREIQQQVLLQLQVFDVTYEDFVNDLAELETELENARPASAIFSVVDEQKDKMQYFIMNNITKKEPVFEKLIEEGEKMREKMESGDDKEQHQKNLEETTARWQAFKEKADNMQNKIDEVHETAGGYDKKNNKFKSWLDEAEKKLGKVKVKSYTPEDAEKTLQELEEILDDVFCHEPHFEDLNSAADADVECSQVDGDVVKAEFVKVKNRWDALNANAIKKKEEAEEVKEALDKYYSALQPVQEAFTQAEVVLEASEPLGTNVDKIKEELDQVRALKSTFDDRKPDIKEMNQSGNKLLSGEELSPLNVELKENLDVTNKKAKETPDRLQEREKTLVKALGDATDFNTVLAEIETWLPTEQEKVDQLEPVSTDPDRIKAQIKDTDEALEEIKQYLVKLHQLEDVGQRLIEDNVRDPDTVNDIQNKIDKVRTPLEKLCGKLEQRSARLQNAAMQSQEFQDSYNDFIARLGNIEDQLVSEAPVSPEYQETKKQKEDNEDIQDLIDQQEPIFENLLKTGEKVLENTEPGDERRTVEKKIAELKERWQNTKNKADERDERIESVLPDAREYHKAQSTFEPWLVDAEKKVSEIKIKSSDPDEIGKQLQVLTDLKDEVEKRRPEHEALVTAADSLIDKCHDNSYVIDAQKKDLSKRWNALLRDIEDKEEMLGFAKDESDRLKDDIQCVEAAVQKAENTLESCEVPTIEPETVKRDLVDIEAALQALEECEPQKKEADELAHKLLDELDETSTDAVVLKQQMDNLNDKYADALDKTKDKKSQLKKAYVLIIEFVEIYEEMTIWIEETTNVVETTQAISSNPVVVKSQLADVEKLQDNVAAKKRDLVKAEDIGEELVECCDKNPNVLAEVNIKLAKIKTPLDNIAAKVDDRQAKLQMVVLQTQEFQETLDDFVDKLSKIEDDLARMLPVSPVYDVVRDQLHEVEQVSDDVKQLEPVFGRVSSCGQDVLESLEPGEEKDKLKDKLAEIEERWNDVKEKVESRKANLVDITPDSKRYHDNRQSLLPCLEDAESYLAAEEPIPCEEKSLAREEKALQELLDSVEAKKPVAEELNSAAESLADLCENPEVTQAEVKDFNKRWNAVVDGLNNRKQQVEDVKEKIRELNSVIEPVEETLDLAQPILEAPSSYGADVEKSEDELQKIEVRILFFFLPLMLSLSLFSFFICFFYYSWLSISVSFFIFLPSFSSLSFLYSFYSFLPSFFFFAFFPFSSFPFPSFLYSPSHVINVRLLQQLEQLFFSFQQL